MDDLDQQIDLHCSRLVESYKILLKRGQVLDDSVQRHEQLQVYLSCDNIVRAISLLRPRLSSF